MDIISIEQIVALAEKQHQTIGTIALKNECENQERPETEIKNDMLKNYRVMKESVIQGIKNPQRSKGNLIGGEARKLYTYSQQKHPLSGAMTAETVSFALAVAEVNAAMGKIVACPTAGSCGIVPAVFLSIQKQRQLKDEDMVMGLFTAAIFGTVIAYKASIAGAVCGCQAECGSAAAMASAAAVELADGTPQQAAHAAAMVIKNVLGLVCDPVAGLVEVPCAKRNAMGASLALCMREYTSILIIFVVSNRSYNLSDVWSVLLICFLVCLYWLLAAISLGTLYPIQGVQK